MLCDRHFPTDPLQLALAHKRQSGAPGAARVYPLLDAPGLTVSDVVCTSGPDDPVFEERHPGVAIAVVISGTFSYRGERGRVLLTPGALLLGEAGRPFCCSHEHGEGDRCIAFHLEPGFFDRIAADLGARSRSFRAHRLPPMRWTAPLVARLAADTGRPNVAALQEVACALAGAVLRFNDDARPVRITSRDERRAAEIARLVEATYQRQHTLTALARKAGTSPFHFLRAFKRATGATPHQFVVRTRLRRAAWLLRRSSMPVTAIALEVGFEDLSNFIHSFQAEFGVSPTRYRKASLLEIDSI